MSKSKKKQYGSIGTVLKKDVTITLDECQVEMLKTILNEEIRRIDLALWRKPPDERFRGAAEELETIRDMLSPSESHDPNWYFK